MNYSIEINISISISVSSSNSRLAWFDSSDSILELTKARKSSYFVVTSSLTSLKGFSL